MWEGFYEEVCDGPALGPSQEGTGEPVGLDMSLRDKGWKWPQWSWVFVVEEVQGDSVLGELVSCTEIIPQ